MTNIIKSYKDHWYMSFSKLVTESGWGKEEIATDYLEKYWLDEEEYKTVLKQKENDIFSHQGLPNLVFRDEYQLFITNGGCLFTQTDFEELKKCMQLSGDEFFVVVEIDANQIDEPFLRMKFPSTISWDEISSGNYLSAILLEYPFKNYMVYGNSGNWGKYSANNFTYPIDILGVKKDYSFKFNDVVKQVREDLINLKNYLVEEYNEKIVR